MRQASAESIGALGLSRNSRPKGVTILAILEAVIGIYFLVTGFNDFVHVTATIRTLTYFVPSSVIQMIPRLLGVALMITGVVSLLLAWGLWTGKAWAWRLALIFVIVGAIVNLLSFHLIGVVIDAVIVYYLTRPTVKQSFTKQ